MFLTSVMSLGRNFMIDKIRQWALLAPALIPLVYLDIFFYPLVATKAFFFRIAITVAVLAGTYFLYKGGKIHADRLKSFWAWIPAALLLVAYATSIFGIDFYHSFWSVFDRSTGLLAMTYGTLYLYLLVLFVSKDFIWKFLKLTAGVASIAATYAIIQWLGDVSGISIPLFLEADGRIGGTVGNAAFLAGYLGLTFFLTLIVAKKSAKADWYYAGAVIQLIAIILTATRGTILALLAMLGIAFLYAAIKGSGRVKKVAIAGVFVGLAALSGFFVFRESLQNVQFEPVRRIANIGVDDATTSSRLFVWENTLSRALERPFTGYGAEHIDYVYNQFYNAGDIVEQWFDRSHNLYLDYFVQYGVLGLVLFLLFVAGLFRFALKTRREDEYMGNLLLLLVGTYVLQSFFVFDTINTLIALFPLFAFSLYKEGEGEAGNALMKGEAAITSGLVLIGMYFAVLQPAYLNLQLGQSYLHHVVDAEKYAASFTKGFNPNAFTDLEFGYQAYEMYTGRQQNAFSGEERVIAYQVAYDALSANTKKYPYDARTFVYLGHVLEARPVGVEYSEEENLKILHDAIELSPGREQPYYMLANIYIAKGNVATGVEREGLYQTAIDTVEGYRQLVPNIAEAYLVLSELYRVTGDPVKAEEAFIEGLEKYKGDAADARRIAGRLLAQNKISEARPYLETVYRERPTDYVAIFDLAKIRFIENDIDGAVELVELVQLNQPNLLGTDPAFIQSLQAALQ